MTFIDFKKAFDSINRETLRKILRYYAIPEKIVSIIKRHFLRKSGKARK